MPRKSGSGGSQTTREYNRSVGLRGATQDSTPYAPSRMVGPTKDTSRGKMGGGASTKGRKK